MSCIEGVGDKGYKFVKMPSFGGKEGGGAVSVARSARNYNK